MSTCKRTHTHSGSPAQAQWINEVSSGRGVKAFSSPALPLFSPSLPRTECQCWTPCSSPPIDKIRTTCSSHLLARESQADLLTHTPCGPPPPPSPFLPQPHVRKVKSSTLAACPWLPARRSALREKWSFPFFSHVHFSSMCCRGGTSCSLNIGTAGVGLCRHIVQQERRRHTSTPVSGTVSQITYFVMRNRDER